MHMNSKLKLLYLKKILEEETDENNQLTVTEIIEKMKRFGLNAERKAIYLYMDDLREFGMDICVEKRRQNRYFLASRDFETAEVKMLMDAVASSKSITNKKSANLIKNLGKLTSEHEMKTLVSGNKILSRIKPDNEQILIAVDLINKAIFEKKKIRFKYFKYNVYKEKVFGMNGDYYIANPYSLVWDNDNYYCISSHDNQENFINFRVDRMTNIEVVNEPIYVNPLAKELDIVDYNKSTFKMFSGEKVMVAINFDNSLVTTIIDRFGKDVVLIDKHDGSFNVHLQIVSSSTFYSWIFMFGIRAKILGPEHVVKQMKDYIQEVNDIYL